MPEKYTGFFWHIIVEWAQLWRGKLPSYGVHPFCIEFTWMRERGGIETTWVILGFGFAMRYNYAETPLVIAERQAMDGFHAFMAKMEREATNAKLH